MIFRDYTRSDFEALEALWIELEMGAPERGDTPEIIQQTIDQGGKLILMFTEAEQELVGSSWITFDGRRLFLHHFGIRKSFQRQGNGTLLAIESLKFIKAKGYQVKLEVHKNNLAAVRLYEKLGFFAFKEYDLYMIRDINNISI